MALLRKITKRTLVVVHLALVVFFLLACVTAYANPLHWWVISLLGLAFPFLAFAVLALGVFWLFFPSRRLAWISLAALTLGWPNLRAFLAMHWPKDYQAAKDPTALRVLTWNVHGWDEFLGKKPGSAAHREAMLAFLKGQEADVLCFQEFFDSHHYHGLPSALEEITLKLQYPYHYFSRDYRRSDGSFETGAAIFSRFPIVDSFKIPFTGPHVSRYQESLIGIDLLLQGKPLRIYTVHLQSVLFQRKDFRNVEIIKNVDDSVLEASVSIVKKLRYAYALRSQQAESVRQQLDASPYPVILCGDFNDVPNSYTYFQIRGDRQDAFSQKGSGIGRTYIRLSPTLRIDYILAAPALEVLQCRRIKTPYSDHYPVTADLRFP